MKRRFQLRSIRSRIIVLLGAVAGLFICGLWIFDWTNREFATSIFQSAKAEKANLVQEIISLKGNSLRSLIYDYTYSDEFVRAVQSGDADAIAAEISPSSLASEADRTWVFTSKGESIFSWTSPSVAGEADVDIRSLQTDARRSSTFSHFFITRGRSVIEVFGGRIHRTQDASRTGNAFGRLYVARAWTPTFLESISKLTGTQATVRIGNDESASRTVTQASYQVEIPLKGASNQIVGIAEFDCIDPVVSSLNSQSIYATLSVIGFAFLSMCLLMYFLMRWVTRPLESLSTTLRSTDRALLGPLLKDQTEIGEVANLVLMSLEVQDNFRFQGEVLEFRVKQRTLELEDTNRTMIEGWSRALDIRDHETEDHTKRVTEMAIRLGMQLNLSYDELNRLYRGAMLHDIGKMGIPDAILQKPGQLTEEEIEIMQTHPTLASEMLGSMESVQDCIEIPVCHHEKWDGTGYPRGLQGTEIPWLARIFALADVWDAMRSDRPYRDGLSESVVREFIESQSGKHFDPEVVAAYLQMEPMAHPRDAESENAKAA